MLTGVYTPTVGRDRVRRRRTSPGCRRTQITALGIGAHVPEHPAVPHDDRARERARRHALPPPQRHLPQRLPHAAAAARGGARRASAPASCSPTAASPARRRASTRATCLRRPAPARGRPRARDRARSCCCSTSRPPGMNPQETSPSSSSSARLRDELGADRAPDRARHAGRHGHLRAGHRARLRREDRRGRPGRGRSATTRVIEAYLGQGGDEHERRPAAAAGRARAPILELDGRPRLLRRHPRAQGRLAAVERRRDRDADRRQRRRQVDDAADDLRPPPPPQGHDPLRAATTSRARAPHADRQARASRSRRRAGSSSRA